MTIVATLKTAFIAGLYSGAVGYFLGPWIDNGGAISLVVGFLILILPAYFFVFGTEGRKGGRWNLDIATLKRLSAWLLGVAGIGMTFQVLQVVMNGVT